MIGNLLQMEECTKVQDRQQDPVHNLLVDLPLNPQIDLLPGLLRQVETLQPGHQLQVRDLQLQAQDPQTTTAGHQRDLMPLQQEVWEGEEDNN